MPSDTKLFPLKYVGARFLGARLPFDVLSDLPALRDLLVAYAKERWLGLHVGRRRLPKGFDQSFAFDLLGIGDGSAVAEIGWRREAAQESLPGFSTEIETIVSQAFGDIVHLVDDARQGRFPATLSPDQVRALNKLGAGLRDGERIEFPKLNASNDNVVYLDAETRRNLITRVRETYQIRYEGVGILRGSHVADETGYGTISVVTADRGEIQIQIDRKRITDEFDGNIDKPVQFLLQIELDRREVFRSVVDVFDIELIDPEIAGSLEKAKARLASLRSLANGWHDGDGERISPDAMRSAELFLNRRPAFADRLGIFPKLDGGILFEFQTSGWDLSVECERSGEIALFGIEIDGASEFFSPVFVSADEEFFSEFDRRTGASLKK